MARNTFGQYGLQFVAPEFNLGGLGKLHVNKIRRDELIDLARKKKLQDKYGADFMLSGAPVKPIDMWEPSELDAPVDPMLAKFNLSGMSGDGFTVTSPRDDMAAQNQYMDELSRYEDQGLPAYQVTHAPGVETTMNPAHTYQPNEDDSVTEFIPAATLPPSKYDEEAEYQAELDKYNKEKAIYDEMVAAGFTPGTTIGDQTFGQLAQVETIGADTPYSMREMGYTPISKYGQRPVTGNKLLDMQNRALAKEAKDEADALWYTLDEMRSQGLSDTDEYRELREKADTLGNTYTQYSNKDYETPVGIARELKADEEKRKDKAIEFKKRQISIGVRDKIMDTLRGQRDKYIGDRRERAKMYNIAVNFANQFQKIYSDTGVKNGEISSNDATALIVAFRKILEPTSAVLQGEAETMLGKGVVNDVSTAISQIKTLLASYGMTDNLEDIRVSEMTPEAKRELGNTYNSVVDTFKTLKDSIENGSEGYIKNIHGEIMDTYSGEVEPEVLSSLLNDKRSTDIIKGRLQLMEVPTKVSARRKNQEVEAPAGPDLGSKENPWTEENSGSVTEGEYIMIQGNMYVLKNEEFVPVKGDK